MRITKIQDSTNIDQVAYDFLTSTMVVKFNTGAAYRYYDVSPDVYGAIVSADSVGEYFNRIKGDFKAVKVNG